MLTALLMAKAGAQAIVNVRSVADTTQTDNRLDVSLQLLTQGEIRQGALTKGGSSEEEMHFVMGRTRINLGYQRKSLETKLVLQNTAVWGMEGNMNMKLYEGWAKFNAPCGLFLQVGRQVLSYDDERIIGPNDWATLANSHDVLRLGYEGFGHKAHAVLAYNQNSDAPDGGSTYYADGAQLYKAMQVLWYHYDVPRLPLGASVLFMNIGMQGGTKGKDEQIEWQQLLGGYLRFAPKFGSLEASYYHQFGKNEHSIIMDGWMAAVKAQVQPWKRLGFTAGFDYLSGDKEFPVPSSASTPLVAIRHRVIQGFSPMYGSHVKFYGAMDFFYVSAYLNTFTPGLQNTYFGVNCNPFKSLNVGLTYHYMATATKLKNLGMTLGHELELNLSYQFTKDIQLTGGLSYMKGSDTMEHLKLSSDKGQLLWGWLTLVINPKLFTLKW